MPINRDFLNSYQWQAVEKLQSGNILVGGVGTGKSRTALMYYFKEINGGDISDEGYTPMQDPPVPLYIITTAKKRDSLEWQLEMAPFLMTDEKDDAYYSSVVTVDSWNNIKKYENVKDAFFIFDEQRLVGKGAWVKAFLKIAKANQWILLTATPGDNWEDFIPVFVANGFYKNRTQFCREHFVYASFGKFQKVVHITGVQKLMREKRMIMVNMDAPWRDLDRHVTFVECGYDRQLYSLIQRKRWNPYENEPISDMSQLCVLLRRCINCADERISMAERLIATMDKVIIFYNFNLELELLRDLCDRMGIEHKEWNGQKHQELPNSDRWVYLVQYNAGAEGWNCISTNNLIFYSMNYSYKIMVQAAGRIDRMTTPFKDLNYFVFYSPASIDMAIRGALKQKKNFNEKKFIGG